MKLALLWNNGPILSTAIVYNELFLDSTNQAILLGRAVDFSAGTFGCWGILIRCDLLIPCSFSGFLSLAPIPPKAGMFVEFQDLLILHPGKQATKLSNFEGVM